MCDFGISETIAAISASIAASTATAASTTAATTATAVGVAQAAAAGGVASAAAATAAGSAAGAGIGLAEAVGIASLVLGLGSGGASAGTSAKQAKDQGSLIKAQAREESRNVLAQANTEAESNAQKNFELAVAAAAGRGEVNAANLADRSVRAIGRAVGFQLGTDKATVKKNQELANSVASARLRGIGITQQSQRLQVGNPSTIAGVGAVNAIAGGLNAGAGAYQAFSRFKIPTDGPNLAFV